MSSILLVDDDFALVEALSRELEQLNHKAILTQSADEAIEVLGKVPIDVMVTDLRMRGRDGIELLRHCVELSPSTRTVLMSAYATASDYKEARALGAVEVLSKPFTPTEFASAIRRAEDFKAGFQADIVGLSLVDLLQVFHHSRRSVTVRVGRTGKVHLREGQIIHAETDDALGADALLALLKVERGVLATGAIEPVVRTLSMPFETLLLGTLAHIDEQRERRPLRVDTEAIVKALTSSPPPSPPPSASTSGSALAVAVAASTPPIMHTPPMVTGEIPSVQVASDAVYLLQPPAEALTAAPSEPAPPARRLPRESPDYLTAGGLILLFAATLILTLFRPGEPHDARAVDAPRTPPSPPATLAAPADDVVDPYLGVPMDRSAPISMVPVRVEQARVERAVVVPAAAPRSVAQPALELPAVEPPAVAPASVAPAAVVSIAPPPVVAPPAVAAPQTAPRRVVKRRSRPARAAPRTSAAPKRAARVQAPAPVARPVPQPVPLDAPSVELLD